MKIPTTEGKEPGHSNLFEGYKFSFIFHLIPNQDKIAKNTSITDNTEVDSLPAGQAGNIGITQGNASLWHSVPGVFSHLFLVCAVIYACPPGRGAVDFLYLSCFSIISGQCIILPDNL